MRKFTTRSESYRTKILLVFAAFLALLAAGFLVFSRKAAAPHELERQLAYTYRETIITFPARNLSLIAEISDTREKRTLGLSGRESLPEGRGMLFAFDTEGVYGFWMKDMHFAIDILWFDTGLKLVDLWQNATPDSYPKVVEPQSPAKYALEVPAGFAERHSITFGDTLQIEQAEAER